MSYPMPYYQCPNDESHPLEFKSRNVEDGRSRCKICKVDSVYRVKPEVAAGPAQAEKGSGKP